ncbi:MAG TPA: metallophosphoesterase [Solirubrobacterales bacterium]|nr:metallophosphoesterase [Solirubrobacterales bacterium]
MATLFAISDLHVNHARNREFVTGLRAQSDEDWLIVCGDVGDSIADLEWALARLGERFAKVLWVPGNHELLTQRGKEGEPRGEARYRRLVETCRGLGVLTPEDPYPLWEGPGGPAIVAPLFLLYDYSFGTNIAADPGEALRLAYEAGVVCVDEFLLHPDPYPSRARWCEARVGASEARLRECPAELPTVLVNHFPLIDAPTRLLRHPEFAQWCGTRLSADWHNRFRAEVVVYGHLHIPCTTWHDGTRFEEVSLGYPREWVDRTWARPGLRQILPAAGPA